MTTSSGEERPIAALLAPDILDLLDESPATIAADTAELHPADLADVVELLPRERVPEFISALPPERAAAVLEYVNEELLTELLEVMSTAQAASLGSRFSANQLAILGREQRDLQQIQSQLDLEDSFWGPFLHWKPLHRAVMAVLQGDGDFARTLVSDININDSRGSSDFEEQRLAVLISGDLELAIELTEAGLRAPNKSTYWDIHGTNFTRQFFPEYFSDPRYVALLQQYGLNPRSIAQLEIPPLPF